jgi:Uma2 family endonuclease
MFGWSASAKASARQVRSVRLRTTFPDSGRFDDARMRRVEAAKRRVSFADLQRMPDDGNRYELYDGELRVVPAPLPIHQRVAARLHLLLAEYAKSAGGEVFFAPFDIVLTEYDVVEPGLMYFGPDPDAVVLAGGTYQSVTLPGLAIDVEALFA